MLPALLSLSFPLANGPVGCCVPPRADDAALTVPVGSTPSHTDNTGFDAILLALVGLSAFPATMPPVSNPAAQTTAVPGQVEDGTPATAIPGEGSGSTMPTAVVDPPGVPLHQPRIEPPFPATTSRPVVYLPQIDAVDSNVPNKVLNPGQTTPGSRGATDVALQRSIPALGQRTVQNIDGRSAMEPGKSDTNSGFDLTGLWQTTDRIEVPTPPDRDTAAAPETTRATAAVVELEARGQEALNETDARPDHVSPPAVAEPAVDDASPSAVTPAGVHDSVIAGFPGASLRSAPGYRLAALRAARSGDHLLRALQVRAVPPALESNSVVETQRSPKSEHANSDDVAVAAVQSGLAGVATPSVQAGDGKRASGDGDSSRMVSGGDMRSVTPVRRAGESAAVFYDSNPLLALRARVETGSAQPADVGLVARADSQFEPASVTTPALGSIQVVDIAPDAAEGDDVIVAADAIVEVPVPPRSSENVHGSTSMATADALPEPGLPGAAATIHASQIMAERERHAPEPESIPLVSRSDKVHEQARPAAPSTSVTAADALNGSSNLALTHGIAEHVETDREIVAYAGDASAVLHTSMDQLPAVGTGDQMPGARLLSNAGEGTGPSISDAPVALQVSEAIAAWRDVATERGTARFAAWLTPPELGHVWVELTSSKHGITARLAAADDSVQSLLESQAPALRQSLADAGVALEFDVSSGSGQGSPQGDRDHAPHPQRIDLYPQLQPTRAVLSRRPGGTINVRA